MREARAYICCESGPLELRSVSFPNRPPVEGHSTIMDVAYGGYHDAVELKTVLGTEAKQPSWKPKRTLLGN